MRHDALRGTNMSPSEGVVVSEMCVGRATASRVDLRAAEHADGSS
jgi:hypothetical protein